MNNPGQKNSRAVVQKSLAAQLAAVERAADRMGLVLRIALLPEDGAEAFLLWACNEVGRKCHVYNEDQTRDIIDTALNPLNSTSADMMKAVTTEALRQKQNGTPPPVLWNEPGLVVAGIAPGIVQRWRAQRAAGKDQ